MAKQHYSDYLKKSVPVKDLKFDKIGQEDRTLLAGLRKQDIRSHLGMIIALAAVAAGFVFAFVKILSQKSGSTLFWVISLALLAAGVLLCIYFLSQFLGPYSGIRKGIVLTADRIGAVKDNKNSTYQYVIDIYLDDRDEALMSYTVRGDVFSRVRPGDGVILVKAATKVKVLEDPSRKDVMDVSNIRSGI